MRLSPPAEAGTTTMALLPHKAVEGTSDAGGGADSPQPKRARAPSDADAGAAAPTTPRVHFTVAVRGRHLTVTAPDRFVYTCTREALPEAEMMARARACGAVYRTGRHGLDLVSMEYDDESAPGQRARCVVVLKNARLCVVTPDSLAAGAAHAAANPDSVAFHSHQLVDRGTMRRTLKYAAVTMRRRNPLPLPAYREYVRECEKRMVQLRGEPEPAAAAAPASLGPPSSPPRSPPHAPGPFAWPVLPAAPALRQPAAHALPRSAFTGNVEPPLRSVLDKFVDLEKLLGAAQEI